jgi:selenide, water dikinase
LLSGLAPVVDPRLLVGADTFDDAAVISLRDDLAICFTADFITPVVDDAALFGQIAAANSLSDIYAMGAKPLAALNLVGWNTELPDNLLAEMLRGGAQTALEAGCMIVGGHTTEDKEPKYGLAVIGTIHPDKVITNQGAKPGHLLYLTKHLGTGILATGLKNDLVGPEQQKSLEASMCALNRDAAQAAISAGVKAMTDVTGFGLAGHLTEMLADDLGAEVSLSTLPLLPGFTEMIAAEMIPGGGDRNRQAFSPNLSNPDKLKEEQLWPLWDPQTSGGLLIAMAHEDATGFEKSLADMGGVAHRIGCFTSDSGLRIKT